MSESKFKTFNIDMATRYRENGEYFPLGVYSQKAGKLIHQLLLWSVLQLKSRQPRIYRGYRHPDRSPAFNTTDKVGGGLIVKTEPDVVEDSFGEIGLYLKSAYNLRSYCRKDKSPAGQLSTLKEKLAYALKSYWRCNASVQKLPETEAKLSLFSDPHDIKVATQGYEGTDLTTVGEVKYSEYRALYEHLKERKQAKNIANNGQAAFDAMVGAPMQDQFLRNTIETVEAAILKVQNDEKSEIERLEDERNEERDKITIRFNQLVAEARTRAEEKIEQLKTQLSELKQSCGMAAAV